MSPDAIVEALKGRVRRSPSGIVQPAVDGRTGYARRFRKLSEALAKEVGRPLSANDRDEIHQAVDLQLRIELETNASTKIRLISERRRILKSLMPKGGKAKPTHQDALAAHLQAKYGVAQGDDAEVADEASVE